MEVLSMSELVGTFACPICGVDVPHPHSDAQQKAYHEEQLRGGIACDGWIRAELRQPKERGWYLCLGVEVPPDQFGKPKDFYDRNDRHSQLHWFNWVRQAGNVGWSDQEIQEVLFYEPIYGGWRLRNCLGNAVRSGAESRHRVAAYPKYWRELPGFTNSGEVPK
jgi:hypothetical protein